VEIGRFNSLEVLKKVDFGIYLDGGDGIEILMPRRYVPESAEIGEIIDAFIYHDSENRLIATTIKPLVQVGECAYLKVQAVNHIGAFLDWGLSKDLLVPFNQMATPLKEGDSCVVVAYVDKKTGRIAASTRLSLFLKETGTGFHIGQQVALQIVSRSDLGVKAVINGTHLGLIFHAEIKDSLSIGQKVKGFVKRVRSEDQRIDLVLDAARAMTRKDLNSQILQFLKGNHGVMKITDKSSPEVIMSEFGASKAAFKKALGAMYKAKMVTLSAEEVRLVPGAEKAQKQSKSAKPVRDKNNRNEKASRTPKKKPVKKPKRGAPSDEGTKKVAKETWPESKKTKAKKPEKTQSASEPSKLDEEEVLDPSSPWAAAMKKAKNKKRAD